MQTGYARSPSHCGGPVRATEMLSGLRPLCRLEFLRQPACCSQCRERVSFQFLSFLFTGTGLRQVCPDKPCG